MTRTGTIRDVIDLGTVVQLYIDVGDAALVIATGDGNPTRRALEDAFGNEPVGQIVDFELASWGGLEWFTPAGRVL